MEISKTVQEGVNVLKVAGKLDSNNATEFDARLREYIDEDSGQAVILEFSGVQTLTSAPLRAILSLAKRMQRHRARLLLAAPGENALESLRISGFLKLKIFDLTDTLEAALKLAREIAPAAMLPAPINPAALPPAPQAASYPIKRPNPTAAPMALPPPSPPPVAPPPVAPPPVSPPPVSPPPVSPPPIVTKSTVVPPPITAATAAAVASSAPPTVTQSPIVAKENSKSKAPTPPMLPPLQPEAQAGGGGLIEWFNRWACDVQNALDYWVGIFTKKK